MFVNEVALATHSFAKQHKDYFKEPEGNSKSFILSKQQKTVLNLLTQGYRNAEICEMTNRKISTIKTHTAVVYKKLGVTNAMDAVLKARELNLF